jgi:anti-sigma factor (TIGR02949 family)
VRGPNPASFRHFVSGLRADFDLPQLSLPKPSTGVNGVNVDTFENNIIIMDRMSKHGKPFCKDGTECEQVACLIHEYLDKEIDEETCHYIQAHLASCPHCLGKFDFENLLRGTIRDCICKAQLPPDLKSRLSKAIAKEA